MLPYKASQIFFAYLLLIIGTMAPSSMSTTSCYGPFLNSGNVGRPDCADHSPNKCKAYFVQETAAITCDTLIKNTVTVDPQLVSFFNV